MFAIGNIVRCLSTTGLTSGALVIGEEYEVTFVSDGGNAIKVEGSDVKFKSTRFELSEDVEDEPVDPEFQAFDDGEIVYELHEDIPCCQVTFLSFCENTEFNKYVYEDVVEDCNIIFCALRESQQAIIDKITSPEYGWVECGVPSMTQLQKPGSSLRTFVKNFKPIA